MGYRSDVGIKCGERAFQKFERAYKDVALLPDKVLKGKSYSGETEYLMLWEYVKWYAGFYDDVDAIEAVMNELDELDEPDFTDSYKFLRLGEEDTDVESRSNNWNVELYFKRFIDVPEDMTEVGK